MPHSKEGRDSPKDELAGGRGGDVEVDKQAEEMSHSEENRNAPPMITDDFSDDSSEGDILSDDAGHKFSTNYTNTILYGYMFGAFNLDGLPYPCSKCKMSFDEPGDLEFLEAFDKVEYLMHYSLLHKKCGACAYKCRADQKAEDLWYYEEHYTISKSCKYHNPKDKFGGGSGGGIEVDKNAKEMSHAKEGRRNRKDEFAGSSGGGVETDKELPKRSKDIHKILQDITNNVMRASSTPWKKGIYYEGNCRNAAKGKGQAQRSATPSPISDDFTDDSSDEDSSDEHFRHNDGVREVHTNCDAVRIVKKDSCAGCGKTSVNLKVCSRCKSSKYCTQGCQASDWQSHKLTCRIMGSDLKWSRLWSIG